jgi:hypothetical protein
MAINNDNEHIFSILYFNRPCAPLSPALDEPEDPLKILNHHVQNVIFKFMNHFHSVLTFLIMCKDINPFVHHSFLEKQKIFLQKFVCSKLKVKKIFEKIFRKKRFFRSKKLQNSNSQI